MFKRKSSFFFLYFAVLFALFGSMFLHAHFRRKADMAMLLEKREMVRQLELTDLCLFTDARYTRHPSMADLNTPFQDYPLSFEHFPSGSLMAPPPHLTPSPLPSPLGGEGKGEGTDSVSVRKTPIPAPLTGGSPLHPLP